MGGLQESICCAVLYSGNLNVPLFPATCHPDGRGRSEKLMLTGAVNLVHHPDDSAVQDSQVLIFMRTRQRATRLAEVLVRKGITAEAVHSDLTGTQRWKIVEGFKGRKFQCLVATDVLGRGIDIPDLPFVVRDQQYARDSSASKSGVRRVLGDSMTCHHL